MSWQHCILIFFGGGLGASMRFILSHWLHARTSSEQASHFPWGIFTCNLVGCLLIGILSGWLKAHHPTWIHPLFIIGMLGGFTTFSSFALDTQVLLQKQAYLQAVFYALGSLLLGISLSFIGYFITIKLSTT